MTLKFSQIGIVIAAVATASPAFAVSQCPSLAEANAERVRIMQTELMVGALKCRSREDLGLFGKYNAFVRKFTPELVEHGKALTSYFQRSYGRNYQKKMDTYITSLANSVSMASDQDPAFCDSTAAMADAVLAGSASVTLASRNLSDAKFITLDVCAPVDTTLTADSTPVAPSE